MATSVANICNIALGYVRSGAWLDDPFDETDNSAEARNCRRFYDLARENVLREFAWPWATREVALAKRPSAPGPWRFAYTYPSDCVRALSVKRADGSHDPAWSPWMGTPYEYLPVGRADPVPFGVMQDGGVRVVVTDLEDARLSYTANVTDVTLFDPGFVEALAWHLATKLAMPLTNSDEVRRTAVQGYQVALERAVSRAANEGYRDPFRLPDAIRARM